jgi:perosamine synthetase
MGIIKLPEKSISFFKENQDEIFSSGNLAEGQWNKKLSTITKEISSSKFAIPTCSNGSGLVALLQIAKEYYNRKKVMIQSNTMYGVKTMVKAGNCELVNIINCQLNTLMPSFNDVTKAVSQYSGNKNELLLLLSDIGGIINPDIVQIAQYCKDENIMLLEDCAHSFGSTLDGRSAGTFGDAGVYSFYATKAIFAGEGGIAITNNSEVGQLLQKYTIYDRFDQNMEIGSNIRPSEIQALLICSVIKEYKNIIENKTKIANSYIKVCKDYNINFIDQVTNRIKGNYYKFIIFNDETTINEFLPNLKTITSGVYDYSLSYQKNIKNNHACLPIWYNQDKQITESVVQEINSSFL